MLTKLTLTMVLIFGSAFSAVAEEKTETSPKELDVLKGSLGVWDVAFEVWPQGPDSPSLKFKGVETNRAYGKHWISSDLVSEFMGQTVKVHSIIGYDLDKKKLVGTMVDHGPYKATMTGEYDAKTKTVHWTTAAKHPNGKPMIQKTSITQKSADERLLILKSPGKEKGQFNKFMQIRYTKRK